MGIAVRLVFLPALILTPFLNALAGVEVMSEWVMNTRLEHRFELKPHERTRPLVVGDILYFANLDGEVYAVHRKDGYILWTVNLQAGVEGALTYARSKLFVGDMEGNLYALNARNGSEAWRFKVNSEWLSPPVVIRDHVLAMSSSDDLYDINVLDGKERWHYTRRGDEKLTIRGTSFPAVLANEVFAGFADGYVAALSLNGGKELWVKKLSSRERFYDVDMAPWVDEQSVIAATFDGRLFRLDRLTGETIWMFPVGSYGGFLVENNSLYFSGLDGNIYALNIEDGHVNWKTPFERGIGLAPIRVGKYLAVSTSSDPVYLLDPRNGKVMWFDYLGAGSLAPVASQEDEWFYCLSNYGNLYSYRVVDADNPLLVSSGTLGLPSAFFRFISSNLTPP